MIFFKKIIKIGFLQTVEICRYKLLFYFYFDKVDIGNLTVAKNVSQIRSVLTFTYELFLS
jgi:hypothetical protein